MTVIGWFTIFGQPFVKARVTIPRLGVQREIDFLVDTGADRTCINHRDAVYMGLFPEVLRGSERTYAAGVGGDSRYFREDARIEFVNDDDEHPHGDDDEHPHGQSVRLLIADLSDRPQPMPSLLGRDVLNLHRMVYSPAERRLELETPPV